MQARSPSALAGRLDPIHSQYTPSDSGPGPHHDMHPGSHNKSDGQLAVQSFQTGSISPTEQDIRVQNHGYPYHSNISGISPIQKGLASVNRWSQSTASSDDLHYSSSQERIAGLGDYGMSRSAQSPTRSSECYQLPPTANPRSHNYSSSVASENVYDSAHSLPITRRLSNLLQSATMIDVTNSTGSQPRFTDNAIHSTSQPHGTENTEQGHTKGNSRENLATSYESRLSNQDDHTFQEDSVSPRQKLPSSGLKEQVRGKRQRAMSQKAMLSKALQKANTAVLLDNAANFEGAMEAYNDACELLQLVMLRSSGGDDEKLKLQEIVSTVVKTFNQPL
ncbi:hypothetical protein ASPZODRAFT_172911 [Penicilliopsis zonata CBS 506.65]|uniref:MIT domain-containing protein n=1 Tax=Penicilliopsis zonata CBS 506.65 TaxID=1073090 RepID=A0A1L9STI7_9EURO|nr:hypothetical protein ASPZODRAFT_172911 [Penicilliopsis zonata CBS 506.65]OJJ50446.1 hypothetical protein ASPZODRAFT_172911 [Penicilliopsis zonata CBS 506.65]